MFQFLNRAVLVDPIRAKLKLGYEQRPCSCIQYFNAKANHLPQELKLARTAQELNGIQIVSPTLPVAPPYVNFPNMSIKEKDHLNALARSEHAADRSNVLIQLEEIKKERRQVISFISKDMSADFASLYSSEYDPTGSGQITADDIVQFRQRCIDIERKAISQSNSDIQLIVRKEWMSLHQFNDETAAAWGNTVKWVGQQVNEFIPHELTESDMVRKFIEDSNSSLSQWSSQKKLYQISKEKRSDRNPNAPPSVLDELAYPMEMAIAIEEATTHLQAVAKLKSNSNMTSASSFTTLNEGGDSANPERAENAKQLEEYRGRVRANELLAYNSELRSQKGIYIDPAAKITDKFGKVNKVENLKYGSYTTDKFGFLPCPKCEQQGNFGKKHFKFHHADYIKSVEEQSSDSRGNYSTTKDSSRGPTKQKKVKSKEQRLKQQVKTMQTQIKNVHAAISTLTSSDLNSSQKAALATLSNAGGDRAFPTSGSDSG